MMSKQTDIRFVRERRHILNLEEANLRFSAALAARTQQSLSATGLIGEMLGYHMATGGKRLRALLPVWLAENLDQKGEQAIDAGVGLELLHNAALVHDDIQDGDHFRRSVQTVWSRWGTGQAINAGNALIFEGFAQIARAPQGALCVAAVGRALLRVTEGQTADLQLRAAIRSSSAHTPSLAAWKDIAAKKTGALFGACLEVGALIAGDAELRGRAASYGELVGLLFQLQDDFLDLVGDKGRERRCSDLLEGKLSYPIAWALESAAYDDVQHLRAWLASPREARTDEAIAETLAPVSLRVVVA